MTDASAEWPPGAREAVARAMREKLWGSWQQWQDLADAALAALAPFLATALAAARAAGMREGMEKAAGMVRTHAAAAKKCSEEADVIHVIRADYLSRSFALNTAADDITAAILAASDPPA
jgi:hypothetical protein